MAVDIKQVNKGGRPPKYKSPDEMQSVIDDYFKECDGRPLLDDDGRPVLDKYSQPIILGQKPYTVTGLSLALGFADRCSLLDYEDKEEFSRTIRSAKSRIEEYTEARLFDRDGVNGAKFSLTNNFRRWADKTEVEHVGNGPLIGIVNFNALPESDLKQLEDILSRAIPAPEE